MFRWLSGAFPSVSGLIPLQGKSEYGWILVPGGQIGLFHRQELWRTSWPQGHPDREKSFNLSPRDLGPSPLNAGQVWHLDLCVTLGVQLAPLLSYKVDKVRDIKGYLYRSRNTVYSCGFPPWYQLVWTCWVFEWPPDIETQEMVNHSRAMFLTTIKVCNIH